VIADSAQALPLLAESAARTLGIPARFAALEPHMTHPTGGEPLPARGLIGLQWQFAAESREASAPTPFDAPDWSSDETEDRRGIGPVISRWLREFVPAAHSP
jgi:hypothetical protein